MKLSTKLTLFVTLSKLAIVLFFVLTLPYIVDRIAFKYTNDVLKLQKVKVLDVIARDGVDSYLEGQDSYGSYTLLKEEFIALLPVEDSFDLDTIETAERIIEQDTLSYRILSHTFKASGQSYLLEIGKTTSTINQYSRPLQRIALYVLLSLIIITLIIDLFFTHYLIKPLSAIIKSKLVNQKFPFANHQQAIKTSTSDFQYLDSSLVLLMDQINEAFEKEREFTANASHELMTPIGILQNKIENLMEHEETSDLIQQRLSEMLRTLSRLKKIVNSLLLISRIENEQFAKSDSVNIRQLIEEVMNEISHRLEEHEISFEMKFSSSISIKNASHDLLFQLFYNLVNNAIRYNKPKGSILIKDELQYGKYVILIKDSGIGIPQEELPLVFNRFKKTNLTQTGGYGLGLSIVKSIAVYHNIKLGVDSKVDEGSTFSVIFPKENILG
ncbi:HAMP domain-containing sensor histidine kinase [Pedobacter sp. P351]|uniref:sensor histidine kinase n=1 Tax=Pedobacter superstes TaxID=3133441 RepID=UPI0030AF4EA8